MLIDHLLAITLAFFIDLFVGDPPNWPHPVRWMGALINKLDKRLNKGRNKKMKGALMLLLVLFIVGTISFGLIFLLYSIHPVIGILGESLLIAATIAQKSLKEAALAVYYPLQKGDLATARRELSYIVGRDTDHLNEQGIVRATVETVAENTSDGITAPLFWALIGGAPFALMYRAINTCDSMVGYKNMQYEQFGWASARLDDVVNWLPSRLTAICSLISNRPEHCRFSKTWKIMRRDAVKHASPNSGWGEAVVAAILGIRLGGLNFYGGQPSRRAFMGDEVVVLEKEHILKTNKIVSRTVPFTIGLFWLGGIIIELAGSWI